MANRWQHSSWILGISQRAATAVQMLAIMFVLAVVATQAAQGQTYTVLHYFTGGTDGSYPSVGLTIDKGSLYGTAFSGGDLSCDAPRGCGTVFRLAHRGSGWVFAPLYGFVGGNDGIYPQARVIFGPDGALYGTTEEGGH